MQKVMVNENTRICVVCNNNIKTDESTATSIDGLWVCSSNCSNKFLKKKQKWTVEEWNALCKMQALYEDRKRAETSNAQKEFSEIK